MDFEAHIAFVVGLIVLDLDPEFLPEILDALVDVLKGIASVLDGIPLAEHIVIDTVQGQDLRHNVVSFFFVQTSGTVSFSIIGPVEDGRPSTTGKTPLPVRPACRRRRPSVARLRLSPPSGTA